MHSDSVLIDAAQRCADTYARILNAKLGDRIPVPVPLLFNLQDDDPKCAGRAHSSMLINLNMILYRDNAEFFLNDTIPHELGHLLQYATFDHHGVRTPGHGPEWKEAMRVMGKPGAKKYHDLDTTKSVEHYKANKSG